MDIKFKLKAFGGPEEGTPEDAVACLQDLSAKLSASQAEVRSLKTLNDGRGQVIILKAEDLDLPAVATAEDIAREARTLAPKNKELTAKLTEMRESISKNADAVKRMELMTAQSVVDAAIQNQWLDAVERDHAISWYLKDPVETTKWINSRKYKQVLAKEIGGGEPGGASAWDEIDSKAKELCARDKNLTLSQAHAKVQTDNPELSQRYREEQLKGGGR